MKSKVSVGAHSLTVYRTGLLGVKLATEYFNTELDKTRSERNTRTTTTSTNNSNNEVTDIENDSRQGISLNRLLSRSSSDRNSIRIAHESGQFAVRKTSEIISAQTIIGLKHNEEVDNIDKWAEQMQEPTLIKKIQNFFCWKEDKIMSNTENSLHISTTNNNNSNNNSNTTPPPPPNNNNTNINTITTKENP